MFLKVFSDSENDYAADSGGAVFPTIVNTEAEEEGVEQI